MWMTGTKNEKENLIMLFMLNCNRLTPFGIRRLDTVKEVHSLLAYC